MRKAKVQWELTLWVVGGEKNQKLRIRLGLKKEKYRPGLPLQEDKCDNEIIGRRQNFLALIL